MARVTIRAWNAEGYQRDILVVDERQERMRDARVKNGDHGPMIDPADFPEAVKFEVIVQE